MLERLNGPPRWVGIAAFSVPVLAWLAAAFGRALPDIVSRALVIAAFAILLWGSAAWAARAWRAEDGSAAASRALLVLLAISALVRFVGLDFELITHWYNDEGVFRVQGRAINQGALLPANFNYGHLSFYLSAFVLWLEELFPRASAGLVRVFFDAPTPTAVSMALLRSGSALAAALTTIPVFVIGLRLVGLGGAVIGAGLIAFSPLYNQVAHLAISDVPAALFATLALMYAARLLERESTRDYLLAGCAAALAAACKYPAGVAAVGIVGVWIYWRWRRRDFNWLLIGSGLVSVATFLVVMPGLWLDFDRAVRGSGLDLLFGWRQYRTGQWVGLSPASPLLWYGAELTRNFGIPALVLGLTGAWLLPTAERIKLGALSVFPVAYMGLIASMSLVVHRNLQPLMPVLAALLGAGVAGWAALLARRAGDRRGRLFAVFAIAALALPAVRSVAWDFSQIRPGTNELTAAWIAANVPDGAAIVKESNTPGLDPRQHVILQVPLAVNVEPPELESGRWDYLILSSRAWGAYFDPRAWRRPQHRLVYERYRELQETLEPVVEFEPTWARSGPLLTVYRLDAPTPRYRTARRFGPKDVAHVNDDRLQTGDRSPIRFSRRGQAVAFKDYFEPGTYRLDLKTKPRSARAWVHVASAGNREIGTLGPERSATLDLPARDKYLFRVFLARGELHRLSVERLGLEAE